ncbi:MAG: hypothetical protein ACPGEG_05280 [Salibacteraceae bacterium]
MGKRIYLSSSISAGPSLTETDDNGNFKFGINLTGTASLNFVTSKKNVLSLNYKRYSANATIYNYEIDTWGIDEEYDRIGNYRINSQELGLAIKFFQKNLDAPLGVYISWGIGFAVTQLETSFNALSITTDGWGQPLAYDLYRFDNSIIMYSPLLRFGLGKQTIFGKRFFYNYGLDLSFNFAGAKSIADELSYTFIFAENDEHMSQEDFEKFTKMGVQKRLFFNQLINFRMGIGVLLF